LNTRRNIGGFTLIEVTVALLLISMVLTFVYESFVLTIQTKEMVEKRAERYTAARIALQRMERELQSAYLEPAATSALQGAGQPPGQTPPPGQAGGAAPGLTADEAKPRTAMQGTSAEGEGFPRDRLDFTTLSHYAIAAAGQDDRQSDHEEVGYFTETDFKEERTDLLHREDFTMDDDPAGGGDIFPLIEGVQGINFRYLDPVSKNWTESWDSEQSKSLPAAVEIALYMENPSDKAKPLYFSKVVRMPLSSQTALSEVKVANTPAGGGIGNVIKDKGQQLNDVLGVQTPTEQQPRLRARPGDVYREQPQ
jgi:general secretion pathway protein J